jgi:hypothetical protein
MELDRRYKFFSKTLGEVIYGWLLPPFRSALLATHEQLQMSGVVRHAVVKVNPR